MSTTIKSVMQTQLATIPADASVMDAAIRMRDHGVGILPVMENDRLVGVVTDRDITVRAVAPGGDLRSTQIREIATTRLVTCRPEQSVAYARQLMEENLVRRLVVVNEAGHPVGVLSLDDLARPGEEAETGELLEHMVRPDARA